MSYGKKYPEDIGLIMAPGYESEELLDAFVNVGRNIKQRPKSIVVEVTIFRKYIPILLDAYIRMCEGLRKANMTYERVTNIEYDRSHKRWSNNEDEQLIEYVCRDDMNIHKLSTIFGRSPGAIKTHISELVGRKRLSQEIAGRFIGTINGEEMNADISGTLFKEG